MPPVSIRRSFAPPSRTPEDIPALVHRASNSRSPAEPGAPGPFPLSRTSPGRGPRRSPACPRWDTRPSPTAALAVPECPRWLAFLPSSGHRLSNSALLQGAAPPVRTRNACDVRQDPSCLARDYRMSRQGLCQGLTGPAAAVGLPNSRQSVNRKFLKNGRPCRAETGSPTSGQLETSCLRQEKPRPRPGGERGRAGIRL